jgi:pyrroloquinoline quinone biosynthesis protein E
MDRPLGLLAELTYRCPLHCLYCSNPVAVPDSAELALPEWFRVFEQAQQLGVLQLHLSGGEPLARPDLTPLVARARELGFYVNLVTSGVGLDKPRAGELAHAGLDHVQLSLQDADRGAADETAGARVFDRKMVAAAAITALGLPLTINVVLHRANIGRIGAIADLAVALGADRLELAHTQYYGWALLNRSALLPTRDQVVAAEQAVGAGTSGSRRHARDCVRRRGLLRAVPEAVHARVGTAAHHHRAGWPGTALPGGCADCRARFRQRG